MQQVKNLPANAKTQVWPPGQEDPLEEEMTTHSSIFAWNIPWTEDPSGYGSGAAKSCTQRSTVQPAQCVSSSCSHLELSLFLLSSWWEYNSASYGFNLHSSFKKWFSIFFLELSIQNLSLGQEEGKSWKGGSGFYWFIVLYPFWIWILCLAYIEYTPNIFLSLYVLPFHSLDNVLWWREILNFRVIRCIHFAIYG